jgi:SAM-dependent methyltransferase
MLVRRHVRPDTRILDLGCGRGGLVELLYREVALAAGVDPDFLSLAQHRQPAVHRAVATAGRLPFPDGCFDLVLCVWVLEHLSHPRCAFQEVARVLCPPDPARGWDGGHLIFLTPNARHPLIGANRLLGWIGVQQERLIKRLYDRAESDTFRAVYCANTRQQLEQLAAAASLAPVAFYNIGDPTYLAFNEVLYRSAVLLERVIPERCKIHLVGDFVYDPS